VAVTTVWYTAFCPFGGLGAGARGLQDGRIEMLGREARFRIIGGIDFDAAACADFEYLTGAPEACADVSTLTTADIRRIAGDVAPDMVFMSPPCKGASGLLSDAKSKTAKYSEMNELALAWTRLMLDAWPEPPRLVLLENVPRLKTRAGAMLRKVRALLRSAGYLIQDGFHDCGELGGLAQHRRRYLMVARHARRVPPLLYQPVKRRVRACGEVIGPLSMPGDPAGGPMHVMPRISWLNWVRLALIPPGGDWRDLPGVLEEGEKRREKFKRHAVEDWAAPVGTVGGPGTNGVENVADPRIGMAACKPGSYHNNYRVEAWGGPSHTVIGATRPGSGAPSVADPRVKTAFDHGYMVLPWTAPSPTVAGKSHPGNGAYSVADPRLTCEPRERSHAYGVLSWAEAAKTVTGAAAMDNGAWAVADPRLPDAPPAFVITDPRKPPPVVPVIIAADGTWHRPLTTLELAALQGLPTMVNGEPLKLHGTSSSAWRERIGNAVPPPAAKAIAERMLVSLLQADFETFSLAPPDSPVWVEPDRYARFPG
jgi:site-specific DNA-cytosine methylase